VIVIDASSLAKYVLKEENWNIVREHLEEDSYSLDLALAEVANAIWKHHIIHKKVNLENALLMFKVLDTIKEVVTFESLLIYLKDAQKISIEERISIYDSLYITQSKKYHKLLTSDKKQHKIAEKIGIEVIFVD